MGYISSIGSDILAIITILFTMNLAFRNQIINKKNTVAFIKALFITAILIILDVTVAFLEKGSGENIIIWHTIFCVMALVLAPVVSYILVEVNYEEGEHIPAYTAVPVYINAVFCLFSMLKPWVFFIDNENHFVRGKLFLVPILICMVYIVALLVMSLRKNDRYDRGERTFLSAIYIVIIAVVFMDLIDKNARLIWPMVAICLMLYYVFLRELQFKFDALTQIRNRAAFEKQMQNYIANEKKAIVVCDLNDLKYINDEIGHQAGDEAIRSAAKIIKASFTNIGTCYRIGGDEFCVILDTNKEEMIENTIKKMESVLFMRNQSRHVPLRIAHGYATFSDVTKKNIYGVFSAADQAMYENKAQMKKAYNLKDIMAKKKSE